MNFQQLRIIRESVRRNFNLTEVANHLYTSQSGVSKHIKDLEDELGVEIYHRRGKRLLGLTDVGQELSLIVERMLVDANNIRNLAEQCRQADTGTLTIATTHTQARYILPSVITQFKQKYPRVHLRLHQGDPKEIAAMLKAGQADIGIATEVLSEQSELVSFPYFKWQHAIVAPKNHPLCLMDSPSLETVAEFPIITYHEGFTGRSAIETAFQSLGIVPEIVMSALDADVIKSYVALQLGVGIIASVAFDEERDKDLKLVDCSYRFEPHWSQIAVRRGHFLREFAYDFMGMCSPELSRDVIIDDLGQ